MSDPTVKITQWAIDGVPHEEAFVPTDTIPGAVSHGPWTVQLLHTGQLCVLHTTSATRRCYSNRMQCGAPTWMPISFAFGSLVLRDIMRPSRVYVLFASGEPVQYKLLTVDLARPIATTDMADVYGDIFAVCDGHELAVVSMDYTVYITVPDKYTIQQIAILGHVQAGQESTLYLAAACTNLCVYMCHVTLCNGTITHVKSRAVDPPTNALRVVALTRCLIHGSPFAAVQSACGKNETVLALLDPLSDDTHSPVQILEDGYVVARQTGTTDCYTLLLQHAVSGHLILFRPERPKATEIVDTYNPPPNVALFNTRIIGRRIVSINPTKTQRQRRVFSATMFCKGCPTGYKPDGEPCPQCIGNVLV